MENDVSKLTEARAQLALYDFGEFVCFGHAHVRIHAYIGFDSHAVAYLAGVNVVRVADAGCAEDYVENFVLSCCVERLFEQLVECGHDELPCHFYYEQTDDGCGYRIEYYPAGA